MSEHPALRFDHDRLRTANGETRSPDRLRSHFLLERELADRLRRSEPAERCDLYGEVYAELFARMPDHPQHKVDPDRRIRTTRNQVNMLRGFLGPHSNFVEVGCGDAAVARGVAAFTQAVVGIDVTPALIDAAATPDNFRFLQTRGVEFNLPDGWADIVYSNQLMEHLHPDDARLQLAEIHRILKPGGRYICSTPSRVTGPHDISVYFAHAPVGFHLREYDHRALATMFAQAGFRSIRAHVSLKGRKMMLPIAPLAILDRVLLGLPTLWRARLASMGPIRSLAGLMLIGRA